MYNYQTFRREQLLTQHLTHTRNHHLRAEIARQQSCPALAHAHQKRVEGFILSAIDKPVPVTQHINRGPCFRTTAGPTLGSRGFYLRRESQQERIQHSLERNSELDHIPFNNTFSHHFREDRGPGLKFTPQTQAIRLKDFLQKQQLNYLPNQIPRGDKALKKAVRGEKVSQATLNRSLAKSLLPSLHSKTYFKSVSTLFAEIPIVAKDEEAHSMEEGGEETEGERRVAKPKDQLSRKENSRQALLKCNMLPLRA